MMARILGVTVRSDVDEGADLSWLGEYSDDWRPGCIDRWQGKSRWEVGGDLARQHRFWHWGQDAAEVLAWYREHGWSKQAAAEQVAKQKAEDCARCEAANRGDWYMMGVWAEAEVVLGSGAGVVQRLQSGGLWGVESDCGRAYLEEVVAKELAGLREELQAAGIRPAADDWAELCASAIAAAEVG